MVRLNLMRAKAVFASAFAVSALLSVGYGIYRAVHSPLFLVRVVEVADLPQNSPVDAQTLTRLANVPVNKVSLFDLDLKAIEERVLREPWVRHVHLQKRFPQTLAISVTFREPKALFQKKDGTLAYIDSDATIFSQVDLTVNSDLPFLSGFKDDEEGPIAGALALLDAWEQSDLSKGAQVSSVSHDPELGYRALVTYPLQKQKNQVARTWVDLGQEIDVDTEVQMARLGQVFNYLSSHQVSARQIRADIGKKIVVRIARGS